MSQYYDPQNFEEDLTHTWGTNTIIDPASLHNFDSSRIPPQHTYIKSERIQPGAYLQPTEFVPATSTHNVGPTFQRGSSLGFDPSSSYVSGGYVYPSQDTFVPYNPFYSMQGGQHNQPVLPYAQQLLSYNQNPNLNPEVAQDDPSLVYPECPLLIDHNAYNSYNSLPYGDWVIRQAQQNFAPPIMNPYLVNAGYTMNNSYQPGNTQTENSQNSTKENEEPATPGKVSNKKVAKQRKGPKCDPRSKYDEPETRAPWGSKTWGEDGQHLFSYTKKGQLLRDRKLNNEQLREYVGNCPKGTVFRVQQYPTGSRYRMDPEDQECRWEHCPLRSRKITTGWLRVCFDEFPTDTTSGKRDPFICAGSMHLWCFERVFDPVEFYLGGRLKAETRHLIHEPNVASLGKHTDNGIVKGAYEEWFTKRVRSFNQHGKFLVGREYRDTLSYDLNEYHLENQTAARRKARKSRHEQKNNKGGPEKTINIHMGDLELYVKLNQIANGARRAGAPEREAGENLPDDGLDSPDTSRKSISPPPAPRAKKTRRSQRMASCLPIDPALGTSSSHSSQTQRRSPKGSDLKRTSPRRLKKEVRRHVLASQPPVDRGHNLSMDSCSSNSTSTGNLNTNSKPSSSFGPLNSACSTLPSSNLRPPLEITIPSNHNEGNLANAYPSVYPQAMPGPSFGMEDPKQPGHSLGPPPWQFQQQQYSSTAALPYAKAEHQPLFQGCNLKTPLKVSRGNDLVESCQNETKTWTPKAAEEAQQALGDSEGTSSIDSHQFTGLGPEEANLYQFLINDEDVPESTQNPAEGSTGAMDNFAAQTQTNAAASQSLELVACTESPHVAAVAEPWHSAGSFMDPVNYGGYSNTDIFQLFDDSIATA